MCTWSVENAYILEGDDSGIKSAAVSPGSRIAIDSGRSHSMILMFRIWLYVLPSKEFRKGEREEVYDFKTGVEGWGGGMGKGEVKRAQASHNAMCFPL